MTKQNYGMSQALPTAFITQNKHRVRQYSNSVYLNDGDSFEIELYNPLPTRILAKIYLNFQPIHNAGIVLNPGQRVHLERFIETNNRFVFETYKVEANNADVRRAIQNNGSVRVEFFHEQVYVQPQNHTAGLLYSNSVGTWDSSKSFGQCTYNTGTTTLLCDSNVSYTTNGNVGIGANSPSAKLHVNGGIIETGRISQGKASNQELNSTYGTFNSYSFEVNQWKILPMSQKPYEARDMKVYCAACGTRQRKSTDMYCYKCGAKF